MSKQLRSELEANLRRKMGYDLRLISINKKAKIQDILQENKLDQQPVLIKQGKKYFIHGLSPEGQWRHIPLNPAREGLKKLNFTKLSLSKRPTNISLLEANQIPKTLSAEITFKQGHFLDDIHDHVRGFYKFDESDGRLYYSVGEGNKKGIGAILKDYPRGIVVNSKTYPIYKMWQNWLISLKPQEAAYLSKLDEEARDLLMPPSTIAVEQKEEMKEDLEQKQEQKEKNLFGLFLRRELNLSKSDLNTLALQYIQGSLNCVHTSKSILTQLMAPNYELRANFDTSHSIAEIPASFRHYLLRGKHYRVNALGGIFNISHHSGFRTEVKTDSPGMGRFTEKGWEIFNLGGNIEPLLQETLIPSEREIEEKIKRNPKQFCTDLTDKMEAAGKKHRESFALVCKQLKEIKTHDLAIQEIQWYAEKISELPDVILPHFTAFLDSTIKFLQNDPAISGIEIHAHAIEYYTLLMLHEQEKLNETIHKIYSEELDPDLKSQLGQLLYVQIDNATKAHNPMRYNLVVVIAALNNKIQEIFANKEAFVLNWQFKKHQEQVESKASSPLSPEEFEKLFKENNSSKKFEEVFKEIATLALAEEIRQLQLLNNKIEDNQKKFFGEAQSTQSTIVSADEKSKASSLVEDKEHKSNSILFISREQEKQLSIPEEEKKDEVYEVKKSSKKKYSPELHHATNEVKLLEEIGENGATPEQLHFIDILGNAIVTLDEKGAPNKSFYTGIAGTDQKRFGPGTEKEFPFGIGISSGPLTKPDRDSEFQQQSQVPSATIVTPEQIARIGSQPLNNFAKDVLRYFLWPKTQKKEDKEKSSPKEKEIIKWLLSGHSRGGIVVRWLLNGIPEVKRVKIRHNDTNYTIEINAKGKSIKIFAAETLVEEYQLQADVIDLSGTTGPKMKGRLDFIEFYPENFLSFLAAADSNVPTDKWYLPGYGTGMKPQNQRRTFFDYITTQFTLFVHLPVDHPRVTMAKKDRVLHMEIIVLLSYLYLTHLGYTVDVDKLKIPYRSKGKTDKDTTTRLLDTTLEDGTLFSSKNCDVEKCLRSLQKKYSEMQQLVKDKVYGHKGIGPVDIREKDDKDKLVLHSQQHATAIEERLTKTLAASSSDGMLATFFSSAITEEEIAFKDFAQTLMSKTGLDDPDCKNPVHEETFLKLKVAAHLRDSRFTAHLFNLVNLPFSMQNSEMETVKEVVGSHQITASTIKAYALSRMREIEMQCQSLLSQDYTTEETKEAILKNLAVSFDNDYKQGMIDIETYIGCQKNLLSFKELTPYESKTTPTAKLVESLLQQLIHHPRWNHETTFGSVKTYISSCRFFSCRRAVNSGFYGPEGVRQLRELKEFDLETIANIAQNRLIKTRLTRSPATEDFYKILTLFNDPAIKPVIIKRALRLFAEKHNFPITLTQSKIREFKQEQVINEVTDRSAIELC